MSEFRDQRVIYVAGPYRAPTEWEVVQNIRRAEEAAIALWKLGAAVICPHKNTAFFGGLMHDDCWLEGDRTILRRCDAVFCIAGWQGSVGASSEVALARELGIPVFEELDGVRQWLSSLRSSSAGGGSEAGCSTSSPASADSD